MRLTAIRFQHADRTSENRLPSRFDARDDPDDLVVLEQSLPNAA